MTVPTQWQDVPVLDPAAIADPFPVYAALRDRGPVVAVSYLGLPAWLVVGDAEARQLIADRRLSLNPRHGTAEAAAVPWVGADLFEGPPGLLTSDPPDHTRLRRLVNQAFTPRQVERLRPRATAVAGELIDAFAGRGEADLIEDFAAQLPAVVIMELLGVPAAGRRDFSAWCELFLSGDPEKRPLVPGAIARLQHFIVELIQAKRRAPGEDLLSRLILARDEGDQLSDAELGKLTFLLLLAGLETTVNLIGNGMLALLRHPAQLAALRADPALLAPAVEEMLRYDGPVAAIKVRFALAEIVVGDTVIAPADPVLISVGAANRDPGRYPRAAEFDIGRADTAHLAFGHGIHFCVGAPLARLEARIAFGALLGRCADLRLACPPSELTWRVSPIIHGLTRLPVTFTPEPA
jgi:cytochrome P450